MLVDAVKSFQKLDKVAYRMGLLSREQSYATHIPWWPLVSVLGTFSAGKSSFINRYLQYRLQETGTQAVDDKFTVICFTQDQEARVLPGIALDADPRFPFYQISEELEKVAPGEGGRIDAYLRLKTCPSEQLRGTIMIDSPGFDADAQRNSTLRITDYIINLSDLILVFFDARHPEPGAMRDTLTHLVGDTIGRRDSSKFLYILNQIDATAREDNPEDVVAAWQRAIAQEGLTAGRFYCIYNDEAAIPIEDEALRRRFESKRDLDLAEIYERIRQVSVERAYRIVAALEKTAREIQDEMVPRIRQLRQRWKRSVLWRNGLVFGGLVAALLGLSIWAGYWQGFTFNPPWWEMVAGQWWSIILIVAGAVLLVGWLHLRIRRSATESVIKSIVRSVGPGPERDNLLRAFRRNVRPWHSIFKRDPVGWGRRAVRQLKSVIADADRYIQILNDRYADPSGDRIRRRAEPFGAEENHQEERSSPVEERKVAGEDKLHAVSSEDKLH
jgi:GTPase SAR1 family protein